MEKVISEAGETLLELLAGGAVIGMFALVLNYVTSF